MVRHLMKLQPQYFDLMDEEVKIYEVRLLDEKRQGVMIGDVIEFVKEPNLNEMIGGKVQEILKFSSFEQMAKNLPARELGFEGKSKQEIEEIYHKFYSREDEIKYGVVAFKIKKL